MSERVETGKHAHPAIFALLVLPFGLVIGYVQVAVPYLLDERHLSMGAIAAVSAMAQLPQGFKFLWAPALDAGWPRKNWFLASIAVSAIAIGLTALIAPDPNVYAGPLTLLTVYTIALTVSNAAVGTSTAAVNTLMAITIPIEKKGAVAGWSMAGNLAGTGVGGALALWLAKHVSPTRTGLILASICLVCAVPAFFMSEPKAERHPVKKLIGVLLRDIWNTLKSREGWTGLLVCATPVGTGAATQLFSALAKEYSFAKESTEPVTSTFVMRVVACFSNGSLADREFCVELVNGILGGLISAVGCLVGGYLADRMNRKLCYVLAGGVTAVFAAIMMFLPPTPLSFTIGTLLYQFANGIAYAAFAAFVLEIVGNSAGVTTKYALYVGVSNQAISYVTWLDGVGCDWGRGHFRDPSQGARWGLLGTDVLATIVGTFVVAIVILVITKPRAPTGPTPETAVA